MGKLARVLLAVVCLSAIRVPVVLAQLGASPTQAPGSAPVGVTGSGIGAPPGTAPSSTVTTAPVGTSPSASTPAPGTSGASTAYPLGSPSAAPLTGSPPANTVGVPAPSLTVPSFVTPSPLADSPTESLPGAPNVPVGPPVSTGGVGSGAMGESPSPGGTTVTPSSGGTVPR